MWIASAHSPPLTIREEGADALLLPPPHFFRYSQDDLEVFYLDAAERIAGPILIYNLPWFTEAVDTPLALRLLEQSPYLVGIKDSGPSLDTLEALTAGMRNHRIGVLPVVAPWLAFNICPGEILDDPRSAHFAHHLKCAFDFPLFHFVGQPCVDTDLWVDRLDRLLRA